MTFLHTLLAIFINLLWGSMFIAASIGLREFPPIFFTGIRFLLLLVCLSIFIKVPVNKIKPLLGIGLLMGAGMYLTLYLSIAMAENTASVAIFSKLEVPFAIILGVILLKEKIGFHRVSGIVIAMAGAAIISFDPAALDDFPALIWMAISCAFAAYGMIKVRVMGEMHPLHIAAWISIVSAPTLLLTSAVFETAHLSVLKEATWVGWSALAYTAIMSSIIANSGLYYLLQRYPVSQVAPFSLLSPVFAVAGGVLLLDDELTIGLISGGILILSGVAWIHIRALSVFEHNQKTSK
ncbi:MAG: DMT family transporter [bacterium]